MKTIFIIFCSFILFTDAKRGDIVTKTQNVTENEINRKKKLVKRISNKRTRVKNKEYGDSRNVYMLSHGR